MSFLYKEYHKKYWVGLNKCMEESMDKSIEMVIPKYNNDVAATTKTQKKG